MNYELLLILPICAVVTFIIITVFRRRALKVDDPLDVIAVFIGPPPVNAHMITHAERFLQRSRVALESQTDFDQSALEALRALESIVSEAERLIEIARNTKERGTLENITKRWKELDSERLRHVAVLLTLRRNRARGQ